ncbi:UbiA family prenyltransferase [Oceanobacter mangrovi]|uniref:UbiA family prenyltransferase n=1 Tax=Oceanobacter mangrovi TaxID=2862510 RepID=UPI001C8CFB55|nr:UbiA family prenyltransferase [Oceanobacter mangrovi]
MKSSSDQRVLVVDLDGTLIKTDSLVESALDALHRNFGVFWQIPGWLVSGKAALKQELAARASLDFGKLPYNQHVLGVIHQARDEGRLVVLASACDQSIALGVAAYLKLFDDVIASDGVINISGRNKRDELLRRYGKLGFDYIGNSRDDLAIWDVANQAILVDVPESTARKARLNGNVLLELVSSSSSIRSFLKALRPHQWAKNTLILVPLFAAHAFSFSSLFSALVAMLCFCMMASGTYLVNDLLDIQDDRQHDSKRHRPFAAATLSPLTGCWSALFLVISSLATAYLTLPHMFLIVLLVYLMLTLAYSLLLKSIMAMDVIALTVLYTLRIIAGALALSLEPTFWILTFSLFVFLSLALVKRFAELNDARQKGKTEKSAGRGYYPSDLEIISQMGSASGYMSILFFALYIQDQMTAALYSEPRALWLVCPILMYWITRLWLITHRGEMHDDPVVFAIKDKVSLFTLAMVGVIFLIAL